jgi:predicted signal transduction protein with EAL and GGDEF domain
MDVFDRRDQTARGTAGTLAAAPDRRSPRNARLHAARRIEGALGRQRLDVTRTLRFAMRDGAETAEELSLRWSRGRLPPDTMEGGSAGPSPRRLNRWLLGQAAVAAVETSAPLLSIALPDPLARAGIFADVTQALAQSGCPAHRLELQLGEAPLLAATPSLLVDLCALRDRGVGLALADFGARAAAVRLLRTVPLTRVHFDPALTLDVSSSAEDAMVATALCDLAHAFGLVVSARAPTDHAALAALRRVGVDEGVAIPPIWRSEDDLRVTIS